MNVKISLISCVFLGLVLGLIALAIFMFNNSGSKVTVSFVNTEPSHGQFPSYALSERFDFAVRNAGSEAASVEVRAIEDEQGNWVPSLHILGEVEARKGTQLYLYLPQGSHPRHLRLRVLEKANAVQKTKVALKFLIERASGRYTSKQIWFDQLRVPSREFIVSLRKGDEQCREREPAVPRTDKSSASAAGSRS